jgi:serine/threonine-protein phosphatase PP1 catalytic subunit
MRCYNFAVWRRFGDVFNWLPIAATVDNTMFCVHGGLSQSLATLDQIMALQRPLEIPEDGMLCDLVWADPSPCGDGFLPSNRGVSWLFGADRVDEFLARNGLKMIVRAHQAIACGYEWPFEPARNCLTLFSAPNYCYEYQNDGAVMHVGGGTFTFDIVRPRTWIVHDDVVDVRPGTPPSGAQNAEAATFDVDEPD